MDEMRREANAILESDVFKNRGYRPFLQVGLSRGLQTVHTPFDLCHEIISKLAESVDIKEQQIAVLFNLEFAVVLIEDFGVRPSRITFIADDPAEEAAARHWYNIKKVLRVSYDSTKKSGERIIIMPKPKKQFDVVIMNPPYQPSVNRDNSGGGRGSGSGHTIWDKFVDLSLELVANKGFIAAVHPVKWRKPDDPLWEKMTQKHMVFLAMHSKQQGIKVFGASTPFDWYVLQNTPSNGMTSVQDVDSVVTQVQLNRLRFLPHRLIDLVTKLVAKSGERTCPVMYSRSAYGEDKPWISLKKSKEFKHPCIKTTGKRGVTYSYSSKKTVFFGTSKIIFGDADVIANAVVDMKGEYGFGKHSIGIEVSSKREAVQMKKALESEKFNELLAACRWSQFQIDWRLFRHFRADFWKDFV